MKLKKFLFTKSVLALTLFMCPCLMYSQAGANDSTFNVSDAPSAKDPRGVTGSVFCSLSLPNGKIIIGGNFIAFNGTPINGIARLNADGSLDASFHSGLAKGDVVTYVLLQSNNQLIIGGSFKKYNEADANQLARINANGSFDASFNTKVGANGTIRKALLEPSGKVIIIGDFTQYNNVNRKKIARLNGNGKVDLTFNYTDTTHHDPTNLALQSNAKIIVTFTDNSEHDNLIVRLNSNGSVDPSFAVESRTGSFSFISLNALALQADGKIVVGESVFSGIETLNSFCQRVNTDGSTDETFHPIVHGNRINHIAIQFNGKIVIAGFFKNNYLEKPYSTNTIDRVNTDGTTDATFNNYSSTEGVGFKNEVSVIQADGKIILGGSFKHPQSGIARLNSDGGVDISFNKITGANGRIKSLALQQDGKILIGGSFSSFNGTASQHFTRLNASGSLDTRFNNKIKSIVNSINCIALQPDQKIILGGAFTLNNGTQFNNIARLNANGTEDATFNTGNVVLGNILSINTQPDGKILISGSLDSYNGTPVKGIIRLNKNGTLDPTFNLDNSLESSHVVSRLQTDGKIIIGNYEDLHRVNADGSLDASFHVNTWFEFIDMITIQSDEKILVGGNNPVWNDRGFILRLNTNGSTDDSFTESRDLIRLTSITSLASNKIIVGRGESVYRLNADGTADSTAVTEGPGSNAVVWCSAADDDGNVVLAGDFTTYGGVHRNGIARALQSAPAPARLASAPLTNQADDLSLIVYPNPTASDLTIDHLTIGSPVIILNALGQIVIKQIAATSKTLIETSAFENGIYFIHTEQKGKTQVARFVVNR